MYIVRLLEKAPRDEVLFRITMRPDFEESIATAREVLKIGTPPTERHTLSTEDRYEQIARAESADVVAIATHICKRLRIESQWARFVAHYIVTGEDTVYENPDGLALAVSTGPHDGGNLYLRITKETSLEDIKYRWPDIRKVVAEKLGKPGKKKEWKTMQRDHLIYLLATNGVTDKNISALLRILENLDIDIGNIKRIVSNFAKKMKVPKRLKLDRRRRE